MVKCFNEWRTRKEKILKNLARNISNNNNEPAESFQGQSVEIGSQFLPLWNNKNENCVVWLEVSNRLQKSLHNVPKPAAQTTNNNKNNKKNQTPCERMMNLMWSFDILVRQVRLNFERKRFRRKLLWWSTIRKKKKRNQKKSIEGFWNRRMFHIFIYFLFSSPFTWT